MILLRSVYFASFTFLYVSVACAATTMVYGTGNTQSPMVGKFDPTLGVLQNIILSYSISSNVQVAIENDFASGPKSGSFSISGLQYELDSNTGAALGTASTALDLSSSYYVAAAGNNGPSYDYLSLSTTPIQQMVTLTDATNIAAFTGSGSYTFTTRVSGGSSSINGGAQLDGPSASGIVSPLSVTYTYLAASAVPEPATIVLIGAGLTFLRLIRRRA